MRKDNQRNTILVTVMATVLACEALTICSVGAYLYLAGPETLNAMVQLGNGGSAPPVQADTVPAPTEQPIVSTRTYSIPHPS